MCTFLALLACLPPKDPAASDSVDSADSGAAPLDCAPDHAWISDAPAVVTATAAADYSFEAWQLDVWLYTNGLSWLTPVSHSVHSYRIRYSTQDRGERVEATAVVSMPVLSAEEPRGTVLWTHGTTGFDDACAPSVGAAEGLAPPIVMAARGYVVVAPDYLGLAGNGDPAPEPHPWIVAEPTALVSLDALRAVDAWLPVSGEYARVDRERLVFWGWSEGGFAALQADRYAPSYAPEFAPVGVVAAVPPVDLRGQVEAGAARWLPATQASALMLYLSAQWHGEDPAGALQSDVVAALPDELAASCASWPSVGESSPEDVFRPDFLAAMRAGERADPSTCLLEASSLPSPSIPYASEAPVLLITAESDTLVPTQPTRDAIPALCDEGYMIEHIDCAAAAHGDAPVLTLPLQVEWIDARMSGDPAPFGCGVSAPSSCGG